MTDYYCSIADVKLLINTAELEEDDITNIITLASLDLDDKLNGITMTDNNLRQCTMRLVAITIAQKKISDMKTEDNQTSQLNKNIADWRIFVDTKINGAITGQTNQHKKAKIVSHHQSHEHIFGSHYC